MERWRAGKGRASGLPHRGQIPATHQLDFILAPSGSAKSGRDVRHSEMSWGRPRYVPAAGWL